MTTQFTAPTLLLALAVAGCELLSDRWQPPQDPYLLAIAQEEAQTLCEQYDCGEPDWRVVGITWWHGGSEVQPSWSYQLIRIDDRLRDHPTPTQLRWEIRHELKHVLGLIPDSAWGGTSSLALAYAGRRFFGGMWGGTEERKNEHARDNGST